MGPAGGGRREAAAPRVNGAEAPDKLALRTARRIEREIVRAGWPVGASLGSEEELRLRLGVSRSVLREAVVLVEHHRAARMRRGKGGGLFVTAPDHGPATRAIILYLEHRGTTVRDLIQARSLLEPLAAASAADSVGEEDIAALRALVAPPNQEEGAAIHVPAMNALHRALGRYSGNAALGLFLHVLLELTDRYARHTGRRAETVRVDRGLLRARKAIVEAIVAGDAHEARSLSASLLEAVAEFTVDRRLAGEDLPGDRPADAPESLADAKMSELLAVRMHNEVVRLGWPVGETLGGESELLARYGVSRAVLREAVRILEHHSVAAMRRGPSGGLVVTEPEPSAAIEMMALYLDYQNIPPDGLHLVREAVELGCVDEVMPRRADPGVARRLRAAAAPRLAGPDGRALHTELADLSGNPVLSLFLHIVIELAERRTPDRGPAEDAPPQDLPAGSGDPRSAHARIVEAILDGDAGLARHRLRRHLAALRPPGG